MSRQSPNRRPSYNGLNTIWLGGCYNQHNSADEGIPILQNTTKVPTYLTTGDSVIDPYERPNISPSTPNCSIYYEGICGDGINEEKYCNVPTASDVSDLGQPSFPVGIYHNNYTASALTTSLDTCRSVGFKNVYAYKTWFGHKQFNSRELNQSDEFDWCGPACEVHTIDPLPDTTRYLGMSATYTYESVLTSYTITENPCYIDCGGGPVEYSYQTYSDPVVTTWTSTANNTISLNRYSGNLTVSACTSGSTGYATPEEAEIAAAGAWTKLADVNTDATALLGNYYAILMDINVSLYPPTRIEGTPGNWQLYWDSTADCYDNCGNLVGTEDWVSREIVIDRTHLRYRQWSKSGRNLSNCGGFCEGCCATELSYDEEWSFTSDTYIHRKQTIGDFVITETTTGQLFAPYTSIQCQQDAEALLGYWDMADNSLYPWRTDANVNKGPLLYYDDYVQSLLVPQCDSVGTATGKIYGLPAPKGIDRVWNPAHKNWCVCSYINEELETCQTMYIKSYGAWSDDSIHVPRATAWVEDSWANQIPQGAFIFHNQFSTAPSTCNSTGPVQMFDDRIWVCKYAEVVFPKNSINFSRPCGEDRFRMSESMERCIMDITGNVLTIETTGPVLGTANKVWLCGTSQDGYYNATRDNDYQLTLGSCIVSASALPSVPHTNCGTGIVTELMYQGQSPGVCGRVDITSMSKPTPSSLITCSLMEPTWLITGDAVTIVGATQYNDASKWLTIASCTITVSGSQTIFINDSEGINWFDYSRYKPASGYLQVLYTPDYKWNDKSAKGNYEVINWSYNYRDVGEYLRISGSIGVGPYCNLDESGSIVPCPDPVVPPEPRPWSTHCGMDQYISEVESVTHTIPHNTCRPMVAYFAPANQDNFNTGSADSANWHQFGTIKADSIYGAKWQGVIRQSIDDPFWTRPPCVCAEDEGVYTCTTTTMDTEGNCTHDYPLTPQVEAMAEQPAGSPALLGDKYLGCLKVNQMADDCPKGNICNPPYGDGMDWPVDGCPAYTQHIYAAPWITYLNQLNCVCDLGAFYEQYQEDGILCDEEWFVNPP